MRLLKISAKIVPLALFVAACVVSPPASVDAAANQTASRLNVTNNSQPPQNPKVVALPKDNKTDVPQDDSHGWVKVTSSDAQKTKNASQIVVEMKKPADKSPAPEERIRITKIGYYKKNTNPPQYIESDVTCVQNAGKTQAQIDVPADADLSKDVFVYNVMTTKDGGEEVIPANEVKKNYRFGDESGDAIVSIDTGPDAVVSVTPEGNDVTIIGLLAARFELSASDFTQPDLMFWCCDPASVGTIVFCPCGQFRFGNVPEQLVVFDRLGNDLLATGMITIGSKSISPRGDLIIEINKVDATLVGGFGMAARGVAVNMAANADTNSRHGYTIGGTAVGRYMADCCAIANGTTVLANWATLALSPNWSFSSSKYTSEEETFALGAPFTTTVSGNSNNGYVHSLVIEGSAAGSIKNGKMTVRCVSGMQFIHTAGAEDFRLYIVNANTDADLYNAEIQASIAVNSYGDLEVTLGNIEALLAGQRIKLVLSGLNVAYTGPVAHGVGYDIVCFGPALKSPPRRSRCLIEGDEPVSSEPSGALPASPFIMPGRTPVAVIVQ